MSEHILRVPRADSEGDFVIVNVASNGSSPLDLRLLATEGESPYVTTIKQSRISKLRDKRSETGDDSWEKTLLSVLSDRRIKQPEIPADQNLVLEATVAGDVLALQFRKKTDGIIQRLGEILLKQEEDQEIDAISWCAKAVQRSTSLEEEVLDLSDKYEEQTRTIEKLNQQLEELIEAKKSHENSLLEKFRELLNAKKSKIRNQQRVIAGATPDLKRVAMVNQARQKSETQNPVSSRASKRKAKSAVPSSESSEGESFERRVETHKDNSDGSDRPDTPEASDQDATEDESDDDLEIAPVLKVRLDEGQNSTGDITNDQDMQLDALPPSRELPFDKPNAGIGSSNANGTQLTDKSTLNQEAGNADEETDDDDEL